MLDNNHQVLGERGRGRPALAQVDEWRHNWPAYIGLACAAGSVIALQVLFTRIFSLLIWHHFAYLVIGVALLGGGAAGAYLAIAQWDADKAARRTGPIALAFSVTIAVSLLVITLVHFDPLRAEDAAKTVLGLAIFFSFMFATFFLGGLTIVLYFSAGAQDSHRLYFADLLGAGISSLAITGLIWTLGAPSATIAIALLPVATSVLAGRQGWPGRTVAVGAVAIGGLALIYSLINPIQLAIPESKSLRWAMDYAGVNAPEFTRWNPVARVDVSPVVTVPEPMIVGGISSRGLTNGSVSSDGYRLHFVTLDGTSMTGMYEFDGDLSRFAFLEHSVISAPYYLVDPEPTKLAIGVGGGLDIILAKLYGASHVTAVDLNSDLVELLRGRYAGFTGRLADDPTVDLTVAEGRSFLVRNERKYDIIQGIGLDNIAALSSGAYVLSESYLYTVEALELALQHLDQGGVFSWTRDTSNPPSESLRLAGMAAEALRRKGVADPARNIAVVANENLSTVTLLATVEPMEASRVQRLRDWAADNSFPILHDPLVKLDTVYSDYLWAANPRAFEAAYMYNIAPATDDSPFYYNYFRWTDLGVGKRRGDAGAQWPVGNLVLVAMLASSALAAVLFIAVPLLRYQKRGLESRQKWAVLAYFCALGLGFVFVEIFLIQRFTLFIGYPTVAITTTLFGLLCFSAVGSLVGKRLCTSAARLRTAIVALVLLIGVYALGLTSLLNQLLFVPDSLRTVVATGLIVPLGLLMGMPFPTGLRRLGLRAPGLVPWAWGMNGVFSVLGSVSVILIGMQAGFTASLLVAGAVYGVAAVVAPGLWQAEQRVTSPVESGVEAWRPMQPRSVRPAGVDIGISGGGSGD